MSLFETLGLQSLHRSEQCVWHHRQIQRLYGIHDHLRRAFERRDRRTPLVKPRMHTVPPASNVSARANTSELSLESFENFFVFKFSNKGLFIRALSSKYHIDPTSVNASCALSPKRLRVIGDYLNRARNRTSPLQAMCPP
ncbi:hypothetical protein F441_15220 [Phytophthora nicotianae CJ01A1]|uniref:Uncharacterized protein n=2 Tax=Phytophthora nicotianae TaxID=4792 RepID=W2GAB7_PHYNI|nr:hypothetical protein L915_14949 [Phytophthora nicotianae]ETL32589.1 hypothetical protein L916_14850 [Phytophthora nicotianae]ETP08866.1 hypothetical protein F441_15220 [Phytophthora nicotianae CJ01A1]